MIFPEKFPENQKFDNSREREFYFRFQNELPDDWDIYYSFKFFNPGLPIRELDYIIVSPIGLFIVELKNARFRIESDIWQIYDSREKRWKNHTKHFYTGPIEQVESGVKMFQDFLQFNNLLQHPCSTDSIIGVLFMNKNEFGQFPKKILHKQNIVFHKELQRKSLFEILDSVSEKNKLSNITVLEREKIRNIILLNGNFQPGYPQRREEQSKIMVAFTAEQFGVLENLKENPRIIVSGVVGSGKTMMAYHAVELAIKNSWKCLYICSSQNLKEFFENSISENSFVHYSTFYGFRFQERTSQIFDYIVIDEAQNIISGEFSDLIDNHLQGGLLNGKWMVCFDREQSAKLSETDFIKIISSYPHKLHILNSNIRNPSEIFMIATLLGGKKNIHTRIPDALSVKFVSYETPEDASIKLYEMIDYGIRQLKLLHSEIMILSPFRLEDTPELHSTKLFYHGNSKVLEIKEYEKNLEDTNCIKFSTIEKYQGLEIPYVILVGLYDLQDPYLKSLYYIGLTRSTYSAGLLFPVSSLEELKEIINHPDF